MADKLHALATDIDNQIFEVNLFAAEAAALAELPTGEEPPVNTPPTAAFTATPSSGEAPLDVVFDATGSIGRRGSHRVLRLELR